MRGPLVFIYEHSRFMLLDSRLHDMIVSTSRHPRAPLTRPTNVQCCSIPRSPVSMPRQTNLWPTPGDAATTTALHRVLDDRAASLWLESIDASNLYSDRSIKMRELMQDVKILPTSAVCYLMIRLNPWEDSPQADKHTLPYLCRRIRASFQFVHRG
jgi:hypothetical protein